MQKEKLGDSLDADLTLCSVYLAAAKAKARITPSTEERSAAGELRERLLQEQQLHANAGTMPNFVRGNADREVLKRGLAELSEPDSSIPFTQDVLEKVVNALDSLSTKGALSETEAEDLLEHLQTLSPAVVPDDFDSTLIEP